MDIGEIECNPCLSAYDYAPEEDTFTRAYLEDGTEIYVPSLNVDAVGKGKAAFKGKGNGKGAKGFKGGKGPQEMSCFNCYEKGHLARDCPNPVKCAICWKSGHNAAQCFQNPSNVGGKSGVKGQFNKPKGGGKGGFKGKGVYGLEQEAFNWAAGGFNSSPTSLTKNMDEISIVSPMKITLADFVKPPMPQNTIQSKKGKPKKSLQILAIEQESKDEEKVVEEVKVEGNWEIVPVKLDSGACDWVFNPGTANAFPLQETEGSKNGINFAAANGTPIANFGQRSLKGVTSDWCPIEADVQVAEVKRNLASAMRIVKAGNRIVLDETGSYIEDKTTGRQIKIRADNGEFEFDIWVPKKKEVEERKKNPKKSTIQTSNRFKEFETDDDDDDDAMLEAVFIRQV